MAIRNFPKASEEIQFVLSKYSHLEKKWPRKRLIKLITVRYGINTRYYGNQLFSPTTKDEMGRRLHMQHALNIMSIRVYKPKMVLLKTVLFSLSIICEAVQAYHFIELCRYSIFYN